MIQMRVQDRSGASGQEELGIEEGKAPLPVWLLLVYITLLTWGLWNLFKYWD